MMRKMTRKNKKDKSQWNKLKQNIEAQKIQFKKEKKM